MVRLTAAFAMLLSYTSCRANDQSGLGAADSEPPTNSHDDDVAGSQFGEEGIPPIPRCQQSIKVEDEDLSVDGELLTPAQWRDILKTEQSNTAVLRYDSPSGRFCVFEAEYDIVTVPAEEAVSLAY